MAVAVLRLPSLALFVTVLTAAWSPIQPVYIGTEVDLGYTRYAGMQVNSDVLAFLGMRYAAPPVGEMRWRAPVEPPSINSTQDATTVRHVIRRRNGDAVSNSLFLSFRPYVSALAQDILSLASLRIACSSTCGRRPIAQPTPSFPYGSSSRAEVRIQPCLLSHDTRSLPACPGNG